MSKLRVWSDGTDTYVAATLERAMELQRGGGGLKIEDQNAGEWMECSLSGSLTIDIDGVKVRKPVTQWVKENGEGLLCSTEY